MEAKQIVGSVVWSVFTIVVIAICLMYGYRYALVAYDYGYRIFGETAVDEAPGRDIHVSINEEMDEKDVGELLEEKGLIRDAKLFLIQEKLSGLDNGLAPGEYDLNTSMTIEELIAVLAAEEGDGVEDEAS